MVKNSIKVTILWMFEQVFLLLYISISKLFHPVRICRSLLEISLETTVTNDSKSCIVYAKFQNYRNTKMVVTNEYCYTGFQIISNTRMIFVLH